MELKDRDGMKLMSEEEHNTLKSLAVSFKTFRDTIAFMYSQSRDGKPIANLMSKMWRVSDEILDKLKTLG